MNGYKFIKQLSDVIFWASGAGMAFSWIMMFASSRPFRSAGCVFICMGMALAWANLEVWASAKLKGENKNGRSNQSNRKAA